jgi:hypothetical protein
MRRGVGGGVTDHRLGDDEAEVRARDRISALAHGFRILSENLDRRYRRVARMCVASAAISLVTLLGTVLIERHRAKDQTIASLGAATYRVCQRGDNDRAYAQWKTRSRADLMQTRARLPILDCEPNTRGRPAHPYSNAEQDDFVRRFVEGKLTLREQGICRDRLPTSPGEPVC